MIGEPVRGTTGWMPSTGAVPDTMATFLSRSIEPYGVSGWDAGCVVPPSPESLRRDS